MQIVMFLYPTVNLGCVQFAQYHPKSHPFGILGFMQVSKIFTIRFAVDG